MLGLRRAPAPQLMRVLGRPQQAPRSVIWGRLTLVFCACDTLIAHRMIIRTPADDLLTPVTTAEVLATTRSALGDCGLVEPNIKDFGDTLHWRDPKHPPGLHVMV